MNKDGDQLPLDEQMLLFAPFLSKQHNRVFDMYDALPRFVLSWKRDADKGPRLLTFPNVQIAGQKVTVKITPAIIAATESEVDNAATGPQRIQGKIIFPGAREEIVEFTIRRLAARQIESMGYRVDDKREHVTVKFTLAQLRNELAEHGHHYKAAEIAEALDVLAKSQIQLVGNVPENIAEGYKWKANQPYSMLGDFRAIESTAADSTGAGTTYIVSLHPMAAAALLQGNYFDHNHPRTMQLHRPLARWLVKVMNLRFRQAERGNFTNKKGYNISLTRILTESGMLPHKRLRTSIERIREAVEELKDTGWLDRFKPFAEEVTYAAEAKRGQKPIREIVWTLYPSNEFVSEIIEGNIRAQRHWKEGDRLAKPEGERAAH